MSAASIVRIGVSPRSITPRPVLVLPIAMVDTHPRSDCMVVRSLNDAVVSCPVLFRVVLSFLPPSCWWSWFGVNTQHPLEASAAQAYPTSPVRLFCSLQGSGTVQPMIHRYNPQPDHQCATSMTWLIDWVQCSPMFLEWLQTSAKGIRNQWTPDERQPNG